MRTSSEWIISVRYIICSCPYFSLLCRVATISHDPLSYGLLTNPMYLTVLSKACHMPIRYREGLDQRVNATGFKIRHSLMNESLLSCFSGAPFLWLCFNRDFWPIKVGLSGTT